MAGRAGWTVAVSLERTTPTPVTDAALLIVAAMILATGADCVVATILVEPGIGKR